MRRSSPILFFLSMSPVAAILALLALVAFPLPARSQQFKILHGFGSGTDGAGLWGSLAFDGKGNLYGTTSGGGAYGYGTVFELSPVAHGVWTEAVLHSFMEYDPDGDMPFSSLVVDPFSNLYGTAPGGGADNAGTAFELMPGSDGWDLSVIYNFCAKPDCADGGSPVAGLVRDGTGNLYGAGGGGAIGAGAAIELAPGLGEWSESVLYSFGADGGIDGGDPSGRPVLDRSGNLYGVTNNGGGDESGYGVIYEVGHSSSGWMEHVLYRFPELSEPGGPLVFDTAGNLYGTTLIGGGTGCTGGCGTVYKLTRGSGGKWTYSLVHEFGSGANGSVPTGGVIFDNAGNLYGATGYGGPGSCGCGVVYKLTPRTDGTWNYSVLHSFSGADGVEPTAGLTFDRKGNLYGTTVLGGPYGGGVVFELIP
jgi:uncharacterized repeat protein (TIGR03803 family)